MTVVAAPIHRLRPLRGHSPGALAMVRRGLPSVPRRRSSRIPCRARPSLTVYSIPGSVHPPGAGWGQAPVSQERMQAVSRCRGPGNHRREAPCVRNAGHGVQVIPPLACDVPWSCLWFHTFGFFRSLLGLRSALKVFVGHREAEMRRLGDHVKPLRARPSPKQVLRIGKPWSPYATIASWYLWRSLDARP